MSAWETVIGLEIHVQLATVTKLFCGCPTAAAPPNTNVCPVCLGLPGALPVTNRVAVELAVRAASALEFTVHSTSVFSRKNYFYPDLPKGYQISQFDRPVATLGRIILPSGRVIRMTRAHLEEDAGKSIHDRFPDATALDFNRAGVPLLEIVSEPDLRSPEEARTFLNSLKRILQYVEVSECNMEEGQLRVDANVSVRRAGQTQLGAKQEIKNMNSFSAVERAIERLSARQVETIARGESVEMATYSAGTGSLVLMRSKEESHDYRYFPEPDLPPLVIAPSVVTEIEGDLPELPDARRQRLQDEYELTPQQADVIADVRVRADYFEDTVDEGLDARVLANWVTGPVLQDANEHGHFRVAPTALRDLLELLGKGRVSQQAAKRVFATMAASGGSASEVVNELGLEQVGDADEVVGWVEDVLGRHPGEVARYRAGETRLLGFFMGMVMKASRGRANPGVVRETLLDRLG